MMPDVKITVRNVDTNITRAMQTNGEGYFTISHLSGGPYELVAEKQRLHAFRETGIVLQVGPCQRPIPNVGKRAAGSVERAKRRWIAGIGTNC